MNLWAEPKLPAYQPHADIALEVTTSSFLFRRHSSPSGPRQGDVDLSAHNKHFIIRIAHRSCTIQTTGKPNMLCIISRGPIFQCK